MQKRALFNRTGYMIAALVIVANVAAIASEALDPEIESNGVAGFLLFGAGTVAVTYVMAGLLRGPVGALWAFVRRPRGGPDAARTGMGDAGRGVCSGARIHWRQHLRESQWRP
ncbi:MAG TPA: hypothetical protein VFS30_11110 [Dehalococcoidia bacterium]|nr:hypothetical protein [Dehalococcoidia bacterium]